jgi:hypothetical protein
VELMRWPCDASMDTDRDDIDRVALEMIKRVGTAAAHPLRAGLVFERAVAMSRFYERAMSVI